MSAVTYKKSEGTSGIRGQLYETKLLSLIFYRAKHDDSIEEFQLASNIAEIGAFDDICFRAKVKGFPKPLIVSIQAKHKNDNKQIVDIDMMKYFRSYLKIRQRFELDYKNDLFQGKFQETESYFIIYTSGKDTFGNDSVERDISSKLNDLIGTEGTVKQPYKRNVDVQFLCEILMEDQTISLAKQLATFISGEKNFQMMLCDELILTYHVILSLKVVDISEIEQDGHRIATFRQDFYDTKDRYPKLFKDTLYKEILVKRKIETSNVNKLLSEFLADPTDVTKLSKLIGTVLTYNNGQLVFLKASTKDFNSQLNQLDVSRSTVNEAFDLAAREILSKGLKVPAAFGNKDLMLSGNDAKKARRIKYLTSKVIDLWAKSKASNIVTIDNSFDNGFLQLNGGIAGAIGNLLVLDDNTKLMKITDNWELLGDHAQMLYQQLTDKIANLHEIRFYFKVNKFPKLVFDCSEYEEILARDFLSKLLFYSEQADESRVEEILKDKIEEYQLDHLNYFQAKTDAMFLKYHDNIQKWWIQPLQAPYLTKDSDIFEIAVNHIIKYPLLSSINIICMSKITHLIDYTFTEAAMSSWILQDHSSTVIITENSELTVVKVLQHLKNKDHVVLDLEYVVNLPMKDRIVLGSELKNTNKEKVIVFVCDKMQYSTNKIKTFENIAKIILTKKSVFITKSVSIETIQNYFPRADMIHDEYSLIDMSEESQKSMLKNTRVLFQGVEVRLDLIVDDKSKAYVKGDILNKIINKDKIQLGKLIISRDYNEKKHLYVDRKVHKTNGPTLSPKTLYDIEDDVVLVTAEPGMGKSTLLSHLSLKTKTHLAGVWIVRVNLLEYSRELSKWKEDGTAVDLLETLKFMCQVILCMKLGKDNDVAILLEEQNGSVYLKNCTGDQLSEFELKMFLNFFNNGRMIFLFDGFDEISPHYINEAMKCIEVVVAHPKKHKVWVTSRSYTEVETILQRAFGAPYEIEHFSYETKEEFFNKIWSSNLILKEFNRTQLENVRGFLYFMALSIEFYVQLSPYEVPLYAIYVNVCYFLLKRIKCSDNTFWECNSSLDNSCFDDFPLNLQEKIKYFELNVGFQINRDNNPLHLFLMAHFFITRIKDVSKNTNNNWNQDINTFTFYEQYLESKLKKIRYEDKNKMDIHNPDIMISYDKELADCIAKHKKLAAYAVFNQDISQLFFKKDIEEIKETIKCIEKGWEKTGLICNVSNELPIFIHMTFAEYFAVEYLCDLLKNANDSKNHILFIQFICNVIFSRHNFATVRSIFHCKTKMDKTLMSIIENYKEVICSLLIEQGKVLLERNHEFFWAPVVAIDEELHDFISLFASSFKKYVNARNFEQFLGIVSSTNLCASAIIHHADKLVVCVIDIIRKFDNSRLARFLLETHKCYSTKNGADTSCMFCKDLQWLSGGNAGLGC